jgi:hypothetical protein
VWNLLHLTVLAPRILRWLLDFQNIFATMRNNMEIAVEKWVGFTLSQATKALRESRGIALL